MTIDSEFPGDAVAADDPSSGGTLIDRRGLFLNAGKLDIYGFEGEFTVAATDNLTLSANVGYTKIDYV